MAFCLIYEFFFNQNCVQCDVTHIHKAIELIYNNSKYVDNIT